MFRWTPRLALLAAAAALLCAVACQRQPDTASPASAPARPAVQAGAPPAVSVASASEGRAYTVEHVPCRITWVFRETEIDRGVVMHHPSCNGHPDEQAPLVGRLLDAIAADPALFRSMRTLHWGRLLPDGPADTTASLRLARAAARSPAWNRKTGRPRSGDSNGLVRELLNRAGVFSELQEVFAVRGLSVSVASVEKVLTSRARELAFFGELENEGLKPTDRLPWDGQVWFSITSPGDGRSTERRAPAVTRGKR
jgi:hypothetical protein